MESDDFTERYISKLVSARELLLSLLATDVCVYVCVCVCSVNYTHTYW